MTAIEYLSQIRKIEEVIRHKLLDRKRWFDIAEGLGGFTESERVASSPNPQRIPEAICNYIDIDREIAELRRQRDEIIKVIESLPMKEYNVIYKLFVEDMTRKEVAYHYGRSLDWVKKHKASAMRRIQAILDEKRG